MAAERSIEDKNESIRIPSDGILFDSSGRMFRLLEWETRSGTDRSTEIKVIMRRVITDGAPVTRPAETEPTGVRF